jgi:transposase
VADYVESLLTTSEHLASQIRDADKRLAKLAKADSICMRMMSVPGVGPVTSVRYAAALDDRSRFSSAHHVESYVGLVPGEKQSSERQERLAITKAGSTRLRWALVQAAWTARNTRPNDPMVRWSFEVEKRRGKRIAVVALARKLAGILYAIWRDGTAYDPRRGAKTIRVQQLPELGLEDAAH